MTDKAFLIQLSGYGLTTAEIYYFMPDHPSLVQLYAWQDYDAAPDFPVLFDFLDHWRREIEARIQSVRIAHDRMIRPAEWRSADGLISWD
ncbi:usg protein [Aquisediminimonas profunda]|uniref:usg protein n=1 Tax=Aquisediminimonas profunda TaxID=1550733 RepID=UPI001C635E08|nr:usg protein [Aquisediminimonas profunda]